MSGGADRLPAGARFKVVHIAPTPFFSDRGCHMRIKGIVTALNRRGIENLVCTYHHGRDVAGVETRRIRPIKAYTKAEAGHSPYKYLADLYLVAKVWAVVRAERPQVIHGHLHEGALIGWLVRTLLFWRRIPLVFDVQGSLTGELLAHEHFGKRSLKRRVFHAVEYLVNRLPQHFVCSSQASKDSLEKAFGIAPDRATVVNDGAELVPADGAGELNRASLGLPNDQAVIVYSGALLAAKGLDDLKQVIAASARAGLAVHFLIIGYPEDELRRFLAAEGVADRATLVGRLPYEQLPAYLALADLAIEPKSGGSGEASGKILNYMAAGLPTVCYDRDNNRTLLGEYGYYADEGSVESMLEQVGAVLADRGAAKSRGRDGEARVRREFSWDGSAQKIIEVYEQCLDACGHEPCVRRAAK